MKASLAEKLEQMRKEAQDDELQQRLFNGAELICALGALCARARVLEMDRETFNQLVEAGWASVEAVSAKLREEVEKRRATKGGK